MKHELITAKTQNFDELASFIEDEMKDLTEPLNIITAETQNFNELADSIEEGIEGSEILFPEYKEPIPLSHEGTYKVKIPRVKKRRAPTYDDLRSDEKSMVYYLKRGWRKSFDLVNWAMDYLEKRNFSENEIAEISGHHLETLELWKRNKCRPFGPFSTRKAIQRKLIMLDLIKDYFGEKHE